MNLFINHFAFIEPRDDLEESDVIEMLEKLSKLFILLKKMNIELIIHQRLSESILLEKPIREYISKLNPNNRISATILIAKKEPTCSDIDIAFENDDNISFGNCKEKIGNIDVLYTFLSCAMYYQDPILTINSLCAKEQFLEDIIEIVCDNKVYHLNNYQLTPYEELISQLEEYQKEKKLDKYNQIDNWIDYESFVNKNFLYSKITKHCILELAKRYSYNNSYAIDFRKKAQRIDAFVGREGGNPKSIDFKKLSQKHYAPESTTRYEALKKSHSGILNYSNKQVFLNWHTWVQDCRMYFELEDNYVCFVHYEKKIT